MYIYCYYKDFTKDHTFKPEKYAIKFYFIKIFKFLINFLIKTLISIKQLIKDEFNKIFEVI